MTITDKPNLCKCPKCQSEKVELIEAYDHGYSVYGRFWYRVECLECGYFIKDRDDFNREGILIYPEGDCIKIWNMYEDTDQSTLITELAEALEEAIELSGYDNRCGPKDWTMKALPALTKAKDHTKS